MQENVIASDEAVIAPPAMPRTLRQRLSPLSTGVREVLLITALYVAYTSSRLLASDDKAAAVHRARVLLRIQKADSFLKGGLT